MPHGMAILLARPGAAGFGWFGYTQSSFWQASNHKASSPFRETNYHPELMAVTPLHFDVYTALLRRNFQAGKGATQLGFAFPLAGRLKDYVQAFSGYGQSLIDYNYLQRWIGIRLSATY